MQIEVRTDQRIAALGKTGSGKTFLMQHLLRNVRRLIVLDPKATLDIPEWNLELWTKDRANKLIKGENMRLRVPAPFDGDWTPYLNAAWLAGDVTVYIDEVYGVVPFNTRAPNELVALYTRGRERKIGVWASSQRPAWIPLFIMSESEWLFVFRLQLPQDRDRLAGIGGEQLAIPIPVDNPYGFWIYNAEWTDPVYSTGLQAQGMRV